MSTMYNVEAELDIRDVEERAEQLVDDLAGYHPAASRSPVGNAQVIISLPAETLRQAFNTALAVIEQSTGARVLVAEVMTTAEFDRRLGLEPMPEMLSVAEAAAELEVTPQAVRQRLASGSLAGTKVGGTWYVPRSALVAPTHPGRRSAPR